MAGICFLGNGLSLQIDADQVFLPEIPPSIGAVGAGGGLFFFFGRFLFSFFLERLLWGFSLLERCWSVLERVGAKLERLIFFAVLPQFGMTMVMSVVGEFCDQMDCYSWIC